MIPIISLFHHHAIPLTRSADDIEDTRGMNIGHLGTPCWIPGADYDRLRTSEQ